MAANGKIYGCLLALCATVMVGGADVVGDYKIILERNPFGLKPPPPPAPPTPAAPVETSTAYKLSGITALFRPPRAMFVNQPPGKPTPEYLSLSPGQRQGSLEVLPGGIDVKAGTVKVKISGEERTMTFATDGLKGPTVPAIINAPSVPRPVIAPVFNSVPAIPVDNIIVPNGIPTPTFNVPRPGPVPNANPAALPIPAPIQTTPTRQIRTSTTTIPLTYQNTTSPPPAPIVDPVEQALRMEIQRKLDEKKVLTGDLPPLPPTDLTGR